MNIYGLIILVALLLHYLIELTSDFLNIKALQTELPEEFQGIYDGEKYTKSQEYTKIQTRFGFVTSTFDLLVLLIFWFAGGFNALDLWVHQFGFGPIASGLIYIGILLLGKTLLSLPFSIYSTFVIEERFGFNRTKPLTFIIDMIKGLALGIALGAPLFAVILYFFNSIGNLAWLYCWLIVTLFTLILQFIAPVWIMPLFNKFTPLEDGDLKTAILDYAKSVNFSLDNVFVIDGSKRSSKSNAFFTGFGKNRRVALFDTLIEKHPVGELVAILAHEIGHYQKHHIHKTMAIGILHMGVMFFLLSIFLSHQGLFAAFYMDNMSTYAGFIFFSLLLTPLEMVLSILINIFSRKNEYEADHFAITSTGSPDSLINALKKLSVDNLSNLTPHYLNVFLHYSHPPLLKRIDAMRK